MLVDSSRSIQTNERNWNDNLLLYVVLDKTFFSARKSKQSTSSQNTTRFTEYSSRRLTQGVLANQQWYLAQLIMSYHLRSTMTPTIPSAIMPKSCIVCSAVASQYCDVCQSALYCSRACQRIDWKKQHKRICKHLNVGHGGMQMRQDFHPSRRIATQAQEESHQNFDEGNKRFFKIFQESTFEGSRAAAQKMKKYAKRQTKQNQKNLFLHSSLFLTRFPSEMLSWPNSPLLVLLQFVDPNDLILGGEATTSVLHTLADLADPFDFRESS
jgi:hypothetical protein